MDQRAYLDSSVILRKLLRQKGAIADLAKWPLFSSQLLDIEVRRTLQRYHFDGILAAQPFARRLQEWYTFRDAVDLVSISGGILKRAAEPFPTLIKTLDAIHLATAIAWTSQTEEQVIVLTHDGPLGIAASACGFPVFP